MAKHCGKCAFYTKSEEALKEHMKVHEIQNTFGQVTGLENAFA